MRSWPLPSYDSYDSYDNNNNNNNNAARKASDDRPRSVAAPKTATPMIRNSPLSAAPDAVEDPSPAAAANNTASKAAVPTFPKRAPTPAGANLYDQAPLQQQPWQ